jgi:hypothetical protein
MTTTGMRGAYKEDPQLRVEFLAQVNAAAATLERVAVLQGKTFWSLAPSAGRFWRWRQPAGADAGITTLGRRAKLPARSASLGRRAELPGYPH